MKRSPSPLHLAVIGLALLVGLALGIAGTATAAGKINGKSIKKGTVASKQIKDGTIKQADLSKAVVDQLLAPTPAQTPPKVVAGAAPSTNLVANTPTQVASQSLVAGSYLTTATVVLVSTGDGVGECALLVGGSAVDLGQYKFAVGGGRTSFTLVGLVTAGAQQPTVDCNVPASGSASNLSMISMPVTP